MQMERWQRLVKKYAGKDVQLFVIYGDELHPGDRKEFKAYPKPKSEYEKMAYAQEFAQLGSLPVLVDGLNNATYDAYGKAPNGAYLVDKDGNLVFRRHLGRCRKMEHMIDTLLKWYKAGKPKEYRAAVDLHRVADDHDRESDHSQEHTDGQYGGGCPLEQRKTSFPVLFLIIRRTESGVVAL